MADDHIFPEDDLESDVVFSSDSDDDHKLALNDVVLTPPNLDDIVLPSPSATAVTIADTPPPPLPPSPAANVTTAPVPERRQIDDSRKLFQRLWTDEDEIELLRGFLDYTTARGGAHHHDTTAFYDSIKDKLQLEFNKNQLVEKLRRLKKKYRTVLSKMNSGKDFVFKSNHDQSTFEISRKIWLNLSGSFRGGAPAVGGGVIAEFDDDDRSPNPNPNPNANSTAIVNYNSVTVAAATPPRPLNSSFMVSQINLNSASPGGGGGGGDMMMMNSGGSGLMKLSTRKRQKVAEKVIKTETGVMMNNNNVNSDASVMNSNNNNDNNVTGTGTGIDNVKIVSTPVNSPLQGLVEETLRNCLSPVLKEIISNAVVGASAGTGSGNPLPEVGGSLGFKGVGTLAMNALPLNFPGLNVGNVGGGVVGGGVMDEKWRKQQIMELEVYSKRLELVQEQIKLSLEELRTMES